MIAITKDDHVDLWTMGIDN